MVAWSSRNKVWAAARDDPYDVGVMGFESGFSRRTRVANKARSGYTGAVKRDHPEAFEVPLDEPRLPASVEETTAILGAVITPRRLARIREVASRRMRAVVPVLEGVGDPHNASAILRSADAFGIQQVHVVPGGPDSGAETFRASRRITKGTHRWLDLMRHDDTEGCVRWLKDAGYAIYVASMEGTTRLEELADLPRVSIVFGNEHAGPSEAIRAAADGTYSIPMRGFVESLNVSVAAAITLHAVTEGRPGDLSESEQEALVARLLFRNVPDAAQIVSQALHGVRSADLDSPA